jgi:hypothetical protein
LDVSVPVTTDVNLVDDQYTDNGISLNEFQFCFGIEIMRTDLRLTRLFIILSKIDIISFSF